jgi:hypothetical protein
MAATSSNERKLGELNTSENKGAAMAIMSHRAMANTKVTQK